MIKLYQFAPAFGLPNASPFCMKLETYLRMAGLPYELMNERRRDEGAEGQAALHRRRRHDRGRHELRHRLPEGPLRRPARCRLAPPQRALATAFQRLFEENLYWAVVQTRWADRCRLGEDPRGLFRRHAGAAALVRAAAGPPRPARRDARPRHGPTQRGRDPRHRLPRRDGGRGFPRRQALHARAISPTSLDATAYAFLANLLWAPVDSPIQRHARARPTLEAYCQRMKARYFA